MKQILKHCADPYLALLNYRATPLPWSNLSPAELSMGHCVRTLVPQTDEILIPHWPYIKQFRCQNQQQKNFQKKYFNLSHRVIDLPDISEYTEVWIAKVVSPADKPHSYVVETPTGKIERNRRHLRVVPAAECGAAESGPEVEGDTPASPCKLPTKVMTHSQIFAS